MEQQALTVRTRRFLMCPPAHFDVVYAINPWMHPELPADAGRALEQWEHLKAAYEEVGHVVETIPAQAGLPDMVFAANSALVIDGVALLAKFRHPQRRGEERPYERWFRARGLTVHRARHRHEGEGDFVCAGDVILGATGFRTDLGAHREVQRVFDREVISLELIDPRFYHLDTALFALDDEQIVYFPGAFSDDSRALLRRRYPDAIVVDEHDAVAFGCNATSDGRHVFMPAGADRLASELADRGFEPVAPDLSELRKAGGSVKCCTLELRGIENAITQHTAPNYAPLPVTLVSGEGAWVVDAQGRRYLDCLSAYSALNFGHRHPRLVAAAHAQLERLTLTSRAFGNDQLDPFCTELAELCGKDMVLPMNTGAEGVETAIKAARRWGYLVKGVPRDRAEIIVCDDNFHGRTTTIVGFSSDPDAREGFGPFAPGFVSVPFGDAAALRDAITEHTVAFLVEPVQGEAGVILPPAGYLADVRRVCNDAGILMIADEIQSGLARTGRTFACDHEDVAPDIYILGKALGGGIVPLSAVVADSDVLGLLTAGTHGSTFGGNPLACAVGREVVAILRTGEYQERAGRLGSHLARSLGALVGRGANAARVHGLWAGVDLVDPTVPARRVCEMLLHRGVLAKDAHEHTVRLAPPIVIEERDLAYAVDQLAEVLDLAGQTAAVA
jgi:ornithine--oxo-acid transaminase